MTEYLPVVLKLSALNVMCVSAQYVMCCDGKLYACFKLYSEILK